MMINKIFCSALLFSSFPSSAMSEEQKSKEVSAEVRNKVAFKTLKSSPQTVQVFTKGLVCDSCVLGIRKKLQSLDFVDTELPGKGITLNVKSQLVSINLKNGESVDGALIAEAIKGAGYEPVTLFKLGAGNKLQQISLS